MHPPRWVCKALADIHPHLRLAWAGRPPTHAGDLNPGNFAIVQLYHNRDCGTPDQPLSFREFWDVGLRTGSDGVVELGRIDRGPIFSKQGEPKRDWDPNVRKPMFIAELAAPYENFDGTPMTTDDVLSGKFLWSVKRWLSRPEARVIESAKEKGRKLKREVEGLSTEMGKDLWRRAQRSDGSYVTMAKKHQKDDPGVKRMRKRKERAKALEDTFLPPKPARAL